NLGLEPSSPTSVPQSQNGRMPLLRLRSAAGLLDRLPPSIIEGKSIWLRLDTRPFGAAAQMPNASEAIRHILVPVVATLGAIVLLVMVICWIGSWLRENDGPAASAHELLAEYREMNRRGELSDEEFRIIKGRMAPRIKGTSDPIRNDGPRDDQPNAEPKDR